jgi:hypothetical protein
MNTPPLSLPKGHLVTRRTLERVIAYYTERLGGEVQIEGTERVAYSADKELISLLQRTGPTGPAGADATGPAEKGDKGPDGPAGNEIQGPQGFKGADGPPGADSTDPTKTALLETDLGIIAMHAMEGASPWFKDVVTVPVIAGHAAVFLDLAFLECCAPGSVIAQSAVIPGWSGWIGAEVQSASGRTWAAVRCQPAPPDGSLATLTVIGLQRGPQRRLQRCTAAQHESNRAFYQQARAA